MYKKRSKPTEKAEDAWQQQAACAGLDPKIFAPEFKQVDPRAAQACHTCSVKTQCQQLAHEIRKEYGYVVGIFAGRRYYFNGKVTQL